MGDLEVEQPRPIEIDLFQIDQIRRFETLSRIEDK